MWKSLNQGVVRANSNTDIRVGYGLSAKPNLPTSDPRSAMWIPGYSVYTGTAPAGGTVYGEYPLASISFGARRILVGDFLNTQLGELTWGLTAFNAVRDGVQGNGSSGFGTRRHMGRGNWLFADMHVASLGSLEARQSYADPSKL